MNNSKRKSFLYSISSALISVLFLLTSCTGLINNSSDTDGVTISGNLSFGTERAVFRTAYAKPVTEGLTWKVTAKNEDSEIEGTVSEMNFTLTLPSAGEWTITATGRNTAGMSFAGSKKITIEDSDIDDITVSVTQKTSGKGNVNLKIVDKTDTIKSFSYEVEDASPEVKDSVAFTGDTAYFKLNDISAGAYLVNFKFFNAAGKEVYSATDAINVFDSCTTDIWGFNGEEAAAWEITHVNSVIPVQTANGTFDFSSLGNDVNIVLDTNASSDDFYLNDYKMVFKALDSHGEQITEGLTWSAKLLYGGTEVPSTYYTFGTSTGLLTAYEETSGLNKALAVSGSYQVYVTAVKNNKVYSSTFDFNIPDAYYYECATGSDKYTALETELGNFETNNIKLNKVVLKLTGTGTDSDPDQDYGHGTMGLIVSKLNCVSAYLDFSGLTEITLVAGNEFANKKSMIVSILLPETVTEIGGGAFYRCKRLTSIDLPDGITTIGTEAFSGCTALKEVNLPNLLGTEGTLGSNIFEECINLEEISLPADLTEIPEGMFKSCSSLSEVTFEGDAVTSIGMNAFQYCTSLSAISLPDTVNTLGEKAFYNCESLDSFTLPPLVTEIECNVFTGCSSLTEINLENVTSIGEAAFEGCKALAEVTLSSDLTSIDTEAFKNCQALETIDLPENLTSLGMSAFSGCKNLSCEIVIPSSITELQSYAFYNCESLTTVDLNQVTNVGQGAFSGCKALTDIDLTIVSALGNSAFKNCTALTSIDLEVATGLEAIPDSAFEGTGLTSITIPARIETIGEAAFKNSKIATVTFESGCQIKAIEQYTFSGTELTSITLPDSILVIDTYGFYGATKLAEVTFGSGIKAIGDYAFYSTKLDGTNGTVTGLSTSSWVEFSPSYSGANSWTNIFQVLKEGNTPSATPSETDVSADEISSYHFNTSTKCLYRTGV